MVVEGLVAARAAELAGPAQAEVLRGLGADLAKAATDGEVTTYNDLEARLYDHVRDLARHETAYQVLDRLRAQTGRYVDPGCGVPAHRPSMP